LGEGVALVADYDACWGDGRLLQRAEDWTAVIAGERFGEVEGAFAVAWTAEGSLFLARDPIGHRTLYYTSSEEGILFASSLHAIVASGAVGRTLRAMSVASYLSYAYVPGSDTLIEGVHEVLPGEIVRYDPPSGSRSSRLARRRYWSIPREDSIARDEGELRDGLRASLETTIRRLLPAGEPVTATLSGGIDSSLVVALAARLHDAPLYTFSISFGDQYRNELPFSSLVAAHCRTDHRIVELPPGAVVRHLDETLALLGKPIGDPLTVPNALLFRESAQFAAVTLNGEGGDPCFGGPKNVPMLLDEIFGDIELAGDAAMRRERSYLRAHAKCYDELGEMLAPDFAAQIERNGLEAQLTPFFQDPRHHNFVTRLMAANVTLKGGHHILPKVDALSAPFGALARSPLFARPVVEQAFSIPPQLKLRNGVEKWLLKEAVSDLLPRSIIDRPKSGMLVPVEGWFEGSLLPFARERLLDGLAPHRIFNAAFLERLVSGKLGGLRPRRGAKIWLLLTLESWLRSISSL
jgi:asparagine synthase (glutamine-hydrolysing)